MGRIAEWTVPDCARLQSCRAGPGVCRALRSLRRRSVRLGAEAGHPTRSRGSFHPPRSGGGNATALPLSLSPRRSVSLPLHLSLLRSPPPRCAPFPTSLHAVPLPRARSLSLLLAPLAIAARAYVQSRIHARALASPRPSSVSSRSTAPLPAVAPLTHRHSPASRRPCRARARYPRGERDDAACLSRVYPRLRLEGERRAFSKMQPFRLSKRERGGYDFPAATDGHGERVRLPADLLGENASSARVGSTYL